MSKIQFVGQKYRDKTNLATILEKIKWTSNPPPPPQIKDEAAQRAKTRHFPILDLEGGGEGGLYVFHLFCPRL